MSIQAMSSVRLMVGEPRFGICLSLDKTAQPHQAPDSFGKVSGDG